MTGQHPNEARLSDARSSKERQEPDLHHNGFRQGNAIGLPLRAQTMHLTEMNIPTRVVCQIGTISKAPFLSVQMQMMARRVKDGEFSAERCSVSVEPWLLTRQAGAGHLCADKHSPLTLNFRTECFLSYVFLAQKLKNANIHKVECEKAYFSSQLT